MKGIYNVLPLDNGQLNSPPLSEVGGSLISASKNNTESPCGIHRFAVIQLGNLVDYPGYSLIFGKENWLPNNFKIAI